MSRRLRFCSRPGTGFVTRGVILAAWLGVFVTPSLVTADKIERHVGVATEIWTVQGEGHQIWDYELYDLLTKNLYKDNNPVYQDLELILPLCHGGGLIDYINSKGLKGTWSAAAAVPMRQTSATRWTTAIDPTPTGGSGGKPGNWKYPGLNAKNFSTDDKVIDQYINGYGPQYIKAIEDNPDQTVKGLHDTAVQKNFANDVRKVEPGQYASSGAAADAFTIKGNADTNSRHAIIFSGGGVQVVDQNFTEKAIQVLQNAGYKGPTGSIQTLFHDGEPFWNPGASGMDVSNWTKATKGNLDTALANLRTELLRNEGKEKALILMPQHGASSEKRVVKTKDGDPPLPGEGFVFHSSAGTINVPLDPEEQLWMQEEIPNGHGGLLYDDPEMTRIGPAVLDVTTYAQSLSGSVSVYVDNSFAGVIAPGSQRGDYILPLSNELLAGIPWSGSGPLDLHVRFDFSSPGDWLQLSTDYDYFQDPAFSAQFGHYGLGVSSVLYQGEPVPEPLSLILFGIGMLGLARPRRGFAPHG
jgi:hypothetical protein